MVTVVAVVPVSSAEVDVVPAPLAPLFQPCEHAILPSPASPTPRLPTARRKTMAGLDISSSGGGLTLRRTSACLRKGARGKVGPAAKTAETLICRNLGIVKDGQDVTAEALDKLAKTFKHQLPVEVLAALRALFKVDDAQAIAVENALLDHGGEDALDHDLSCLMHPADQPLWVLHVLMLAHRSFSVVL